MVELKSFLLQCRSLLVALPRGLERAAGPISPLVPFVGCQGFGGGPLLWSLQPRLSGTHTGQLLGRRGFAFVQLRGALQPAGCQLSSLWPIRGPGQEREGSSSCSSYAFGGEERNTGPLIPHPFLIHPSIQARASEESTLGPFPPLSLTCPVCQMGLLAPWHM